MSLNKATLETLGTSIRLGDKYEVKILIFNMNKSLNFLLICKNEDILRTEFS